MQEQDRERFLTLISALSATFRSEASEALLEGYWMALDDLPIQAIEQAVRSAMRTCERMPVASELRKLGGEIAHDGRAVLAWGAVTKAIGKHGSYTSVDFDDPVINATVRNLGGWQKLCATDCEEAKWVRKDFERIYAALCSSGISDEAAQPLIGIHEQGNQTKGYQSLPAARVATGLPPHPAGIVRQLSASERLPLAPGGSDEQRARVAELVRKVAS